MKGMVEVTGRQGKRSKQLLNNLKEKRGYWQLREEALNRTLWRTRSGRGCGPVVRQTAEWSCFKWQSYTGPKGEKKDFLKDELILYYYVSYKSFIRRKRDGGLDHKPSTISNRDSGSFGRYFKWNALRYTVGVSNECKPRVLCECNLRNDCESCRVIIFHFTYLTSAFFTIHHHTSMAVDTFHHQTLSSC